MTTEPDDSPSDPDADAPRSPDFVPGEDSMDPRPMIEGQEVPAEEPSPEDSPTPEDFGVRHGPIRAPRPAFGPVVLGVGIAFLAAGIALIVVWAAVAHSVHSLDQLCSSVPGCSSGSALGFELTGGGIGLVVVGIVLILVGARRTESFPIPDTEDE